MSSKTVTAMICVVAALFSAGVAGAGEIQVKNGQKIAFLGDSITAGGNGARG